ncbi:hypothetical protein SprV_0301129200 [Sparganum proliferum]
MSPSPIAFLPTVPPRIRQQVIRRLPLWALCVLRASDDPEGPTFEVHFNKLKPYPLDDNSCGPASSELPSFSSAELPNPPTEPSSIVSVPSFPLAPAVPTQVKLKLQNALRRLKNILNSSVGLDLPSIVPHYRNFLRELEGCENGLDSMTLDKATIEAEALQLLDQTSVECGHNIRVYDRLHEISQASSFDKSLDRMGLSQVGFQTPLRSVASASSLVPTEQPTPLPANPQPRTLPDDQTDSQMIRTSTPALATAGATAEVAKNVPTSRSFVVTRLAGPVGPHSSQPYGPRSSVVGTYGSATRSPSAPNPRLAQPATPTISLAGPSAVATATPLDTSGQSSIYTNLMRPPLQPSVPTAAIWKPTTTPTIPTAESIKPSAADSASSTGYVSLSQTREPMSSQPKPPASTLPIQSVTRTEETQQLGFREKVAYFKAQEHSTRQTVAVMQSAQSVGFRSYERPFRQPESSVRMPTIERPQSPSDQPTTQQPSAPQQLTGQQQPSFTIPQPPSTLTYAEGLSKPDPSGEHTYTNSFAFEMAPVKHPATYQNEEPSQPPAEMMMPSLPPRTQTDLAAPRLTLREFGIGPEQPEGQPSLPQAREPITVDTQPTSRPTDLPALASPTSVTSSFATTADSTRFFREVEEKATFSPQPQRRQMAEQPRAPAEPVMKMASEANDSSLHPSKTTSVFGESESTVLTGPRVVDAESISSDSEEDKKVTTPPKRLPIRKEQMEIEISPPESPERNEKPIKDRIIIARLHNHIDRSSERDTINMSRKGIQQSRGQTKLQKIGHPGRQDSYTWEQNNETIRMVSGTSPISVALFSPEESLASSPIEPQEQRLRTSSKGYSRAIYSRTERRMDRQMEHQQNRTREESQERVLYAVTPHDCVVSKNTYANAYRQDSTDSDFSLDYRRQTTMKPVSIVRADQHSSRSSSRGELVFSPSCKNQRRSRSQSPVRRQSQSPQRQPVFKVVMKGPATQVPMPLEDTSDSSSTSAGGEQRAQPVKFKVEPLIYETHRRSAMNSPLGFNRGLARENSYVCHMHCRKSRSPSPRRKQVEPCQQVPVQCARLIAECVPIQQNVEDPENSVLLHHVCKRCQHELDHGAYVKGGRSLRRSRSKARHTHYAGDSYSAIGSEEYIGSGEIYANKAFMKSRQFDAHLCGPKLPGYQGLKCSTAR